MLIQGGDLARKTGGVIFLRAVDTPMSTIKTNEQTNVIQGIVSTEVSKLNHAVMNKKQGDQIQFSLEKRLGKK